MTLLFQIDLQPVAGVGLHRFEQAHPLASASNLIGNKPFLKQLLKKMSAKLGAMMTRKP